MRCSIDVKDKHVFIVSLYTGCPKRGSDIRRISNTVHFVTVQVYTAKNAIKRTMEKADRNENEQQRNTDLR